MESKKHSNSFEVTFRFFFFTLFFLGFLYPLLITNLGTLLFPDKASGSILIDESLNKKASVFLDTDSKELGLVSRPQAGEHSYIPSGASNLFPSSKELMDSVNSRKESLSEMGIDSNLCPELLYSSASGLDPEISTNCAKHQLGFLSQASNLPISELESLLEKHRKKPTLGFLGTDRVNVTTFNWDLQNEMLKSK